jgi:predicted enzyme related to lactoylglutathione lyase
MIHYAPGTPLWVELVSPDIDSSVAFYSNLFGWDTSQADQTSGYRIFSSGGKVISGVSPLLGERLSPQWITFLSTDDATRTANHVRAVGGKVVTQTGLDEERGMMILQDKGGTVFGIFHRDLFSGAQVFNQPVSLTFNQLTAQEPEEEKRFYSQVFGWQPRERDLGGGFLFTNFFNEGRAIAGLMAMNEPAFPAHWKVYFAIEDTDALISRAIERGGKVLLPATDGPFGRFAELSDPQGAAFSIIQQTPEVRAAAQTPMGVLPF